MPEVIGPQYVMDHSTLLEFATEFIGNTVTNDDEYLAKWAGWRGIECEFERERRWGTEYRVIMQDPEGNFWAGYYSMASGDSDSYRDETCRLERVHPHEKVITVYE